MNVSYAILTHNEGRSIEILLKKLKEFKTPGDEIVVVDDLSTDQETNQILDKYYTDGLIDRLTTHPLSNNFANQKNFLASLCEKEYIFNIDADEVPSDDLMRFLHRTLLLEPIPFYYSQQKIYKSLHLLHHRVLDIKK